MIPVAQQHAVYKLLRSSSTLICMRSSLLLHLLKIISPSIQSISIVIEWFLNSTKSPCFLRTAITPRQSTGGVLGREATALSRWNCDSAATAKRLSHSQTGFRKDLWRPRKASDCAFAMEPRYGCHESTFRPSSCKKRHSSGRGP
jgi:hypothetical protein